MRKRKQSLVKIQDIAKAAGVSISTVSRVLNHKDDVALDTYERVNRIIEESGYSASLAARGMRSLRTNVIGLIMPDVASLYAVEVMRGVNRGIAKLDYDLIVYTNGDIRKYWTAFHEAQYVALLNGNITDGVIVVAPAATNFSTKAPVISIDPNKESPDYPGIIGTNREGALAAMAYLIGLGHRRIGFITDRLDLSSACQRLQGYNGQQRGPVVGWNPYSSANNNAMTQQQNDNAVVTMFETPYAYNMLDGKQYPLLADGPYAWDDGMTAITFKLKPAAKWSDDTPVTADDVAYTWATSSTIPSSALPTKTTSTPSKQKIPRRW